MATSTAQNSVPVFVPRAVTVSERRATQIAERAVAPGGFVSAFIRSRQSSLSGRAISFADRILGGWLGARSRASEPSQTEAAYDDAWQALSAPRQADGTIAHGPSASSFRGSNIPMVALSLPTPVSAARKGVRYAEVSDIGGVEKADTLVREILRPTPAPAFQATTGLLAQPVSIALPSSTPALSPSLLWAETQVAKVAPAMALGKTNDIVAPNPGYVWLAPATRKVSRIITQQEPVAPVETSHSVSPVRSQVAALPELRFEPGIAASAPVALPKQSISSSRVDRFVEALPGTRAQKDALPQTVTVSLPSVAAPPSFDGTPTPTVVGQTVRYVPSAEFAYVAPAMVRKAPLARAELFRPGSLSAQTEIAAPSFQTRVEAMWVAPESQAFATPSNMPALRPVQVPTSHAAGQPVASSAPVAIPRVWNPVSFSLPMIAPSDRVESARGLGGMTTFVSALQGLEIARQVAPRAVDAFEQVVVAPAVVAAKQNRADVSVPAVATFAANKNAVGSPGEIGVRTEQFAGAVGVRAAGVAVDFVDPAKWAEFAVQTGAQRTVAPVYVTPASQRSIAVGTQVELAPQAPASTVATPAMSRADWALIATFPTQQTMDQLITMKQIENAELNTISRPAPSFSPTYLSATTAARSSRSQAAGIGPSLSFTGLVSSGLTSDGESMNASAVSNQLQITTTTQRAMPEMTVVAPLVPPTDRVSLPGGVRPRGAFLWPKATEVAAAPVEKAPTNGSISGVTTPVVAERGRAKAARGNAPILQVLEGGNQPAVAAPTQTRASFERLSKPLLELVRGGAETTSRDEAVRQLIAQPQAKSDFGDSGARVVEAAQKPLVGSVGSDDRLTLGDLTLVSFAAATEQVAASSKNEAPAARAAQAASAQHGAEKPTEADTEAWARAVLALIDGEKRSDWERGDF